MSTYFFDKTLDMIAIKHQTDRASVFTRIASKAHDYARHYQKAFDHLRIEPIKLLEIGVGGGEGIKMWLEFFPNAKVFGVDTRRDTNLWDTVGAKTDPRYTFVCGDQSSVNFWNAFKTEHASGWDVIVDDGGHFNDQIVTSFACMWGSVKPGGFYAIEDLGVAYGVGSIFVKPGYPNHMDWVKQLLDEVNIGTGVDSMYFSKELVIIKKA